MFLGINGYKYVDFIFRYTMNNRIIIKYEITKMNQTYSDNRVLISKQ